MMLRVFDEGDQFVTCARIFRDGKQIALGTGAQLDFEVLDDDAGLLAPHLKTACQYRLDDGPPFRGELLFLHQARSTSAELSVSVPVSRGRISISQGV
jgi:hypothetical protein